MQFSTTEVAALRYWEQLDCPKSLSLAIMARYGDWEQVLRSSVNPRDFVDGLLFLKANAACTFLKKNPFIKGSTPAKRRERALQKWYDGEEACYRSNERLARFLPRCGDAVLDGPGEFLSRVRAQLLSWLGPAPCDDEIHRHGRHGPGTTYSSLVKDPTKADKFSEKPAVTRNAIWHVADLVGTRWGADLALRYMSSSADCIDVVRGDRFSTAPKDALTDRSITISPSINVFFQLSAGRCIRERLRRRAGWDLNNAKPIHQEMARQGSVDGRWATIDLRNASDTVCKNLVTILLHVPTSDHNPRRGWLELLQDLRCQVTEIEGKVRHLEKFSSMGNGYTFELETSIFAAISSVVLQLMGHPGVLGHDLFVFGDDIIVPSDTAKSVIEALSFCGFEINQEKSFIDGPFRESCGGDYFLGTPVRGYYLKRELDEPDAVYACNNGTLKIFKILGINSPRFLAWCISLLPVPLRKIGGPERLGDTVLHGHPSKFGWKDGIRWIRAVKWNHPVFIDWRFFSDNVRLTCSILGDNSPRGASSRGSLRQLELVWVSDS